MNDPLLIHHPQAAELYLIRHGDAIPDPDEIIPSGIYDDLPLSKAGREQAQKLAVRLKKENSPPPTAVLCDDVGRLRRRFLLRWISRRRLLTRFKRSIVVIS